MSRNKSLLKSGSSSGSGGGGGSRGNRTTPATRKIVIRPFSKPPSLPAEYYERTVAELLPGTTSVLTASQRWSPPNVQHWYTAVVQLVSHQYGPRLYQDLHRSLRDATTLVLPDTCTHDRTSMTGDHLLHTIPIQYQLYLDYVLLIKHVFLPLDRTHYWSWQTETAVSVKNTAAAASSNSINTPATKSSSSTPALLNLWQTALQQFGTRLKELGLDQRLYQEWRQAFLSDWNSNNTSAAAVADAASTTSSRGDLSAVWYLWQDVGLLSTLTLQHDLEVFWRARSQEWMDGSKNGGNYRAASFLQYAFQKHHHVTLWPWLPSSWLCGILEQCLLAPHLTTQYLLQPQNLHPILQAELSSSLSPSSLAITAKPAITAAVATTTTNWTPIQQLWMLASRLPNGQQQVAAAICLFCKQEGLALVVRKNTTPTQMIADLLQFQDAMNDLIARLPGGKDFIFLKNTWEEVVNVDAAEPSIAECLAKFMDQLLRNNKKMDYYQQNNHHQRVVSAAATTTVTTTAETAAAAAAASVSDTQWLSRILNGLFVPIQAKDTFEGFYKNYLAKRLLWNRVVSMDIEKLVVSLMKTECGAGYTSKMEGMFQDIDWSRETMMVFKQSSAGQAGAEGGSSSNNNSSSMNSSVEMEVQVLTTGYWPVYKNWEGLHLPESLLAPQERFSNHYRTKYQGRRMTWQYSLGHCVVRANGFNKPYDFIVSLCQALILVQFVDSDTYLTLPALMNAIGFTDRDEMERLLQSLALGRDGTRILRKIEHGAVHNVSSCVGVKKPRMTVDDRDMFCISSSFESNQRRIRIQNIMMKETKEEREKTTEVVSRDRLYLIDAVLVRIMKARKTILHQSLIAQVMEQVKVPAQAADIKMRIESLIDREYLERDSRDRNRYNYLA